jgi:hypothetical protein
VVNAIPHPIRTYNLQTYVYIQACGKLNEFGKNCVLKTIYDGNVIAELLFKAPVIRTAGTVGFYYLFAEEQASKNANAEKRVAIIPSMDDIDEYLEFLHRHSDSGSMKCFNKCLYYKSLLDCSKRSVERYGMFLKGVASQYGNHTAPFYTADQQNKTREQWIEFVRDKLSQSNLNEDDIGTVEFIARLSLSLIWKKSWTIHLANQRKLCTVMEGIEAWEWSGPRKIIQVSRMPQEIQANYKS